MSEAPPPASCADIDTTNLALYLQSIKAASSREGDGDADGDTLPAVPNCNCTVENCPHPGSTCPGYDPPGAGTCEPVFCVNP